MRRKIKSEKAELQVATTPVCRPYFAPSFIVFQSLLSIRPTEIAIPGPRPAPALAPAPAPSPRRYPERIRSSPKGLLSTPDSHGQRRNGLAREIHLFPAYLVRQRSLANTHTQIPESPSTRPSHSAGPYLPTSHGTPTRASSAPCSTIPGCQRPSQRTVAACRGQASISFLRCVETSLTHPDSIVLLGLEVYTRSSRLGTVVFIIPEIASSGEILWPLASVQRGGYSEPFKDISEA
jgi:hypothetical protein